MEGRVSPSTSSAHFVIQWIDAPVSTSVNCRGNGLRPKRFSEVWRVHPSSLPTNDLDGARAPDRVHHSRGSATSRRLSLRQLRLGRLPAESRQLRGPVGEGGDLRTHPASEVLLRYPTAFRGPSPDANECNQWTVDAQGRSVTWAMRLGTEMHEVARQCAEGFRA